MQTLLCDCVTHCELLHDPGGDLAPSFTVFRSFVSPPTLNNFMSILTGSIPRWVCEQNKLCCIIVPNGQLIATRSLTTNLSGPTPSYENKENDWDLHLLGCFNADITTAIMVVSSPWQRHCDPISTALPFQAVPEAAGEQL